MKKLILFAGLLGLMSCTKESETPRCYTCEVISTKYRTPEKLGYPHSDKTNYETCKDESRIDTTAIYYVDTVEYKTIINIKCSRK